ncbi:TPA: hypothetical protein ACNVCX_003955 [Morganella morganii]
MKKLLFVVPFLLVGCVAKVSDYQAECEKQYSKLSDMAQCLEISLQNDDRMTSSPAPKMYALAAKMLGQAVDEGKISDVQARFELQKLYVEIQNRESAEQLARNRIFQQSLLNYQAIQTMQTINNKAAQHPIYTPPIQQHGNVSTNCYRMGSNVQCNSSY